MLETKPPHYHAQRDPGPEDLGLNWEYPLDRTTMPQTLDAIYENGTFRPLKTPQLAEEQRLQLMM